MGIKKGERLILAERNGRVRRERYSTVAGWVKASLIHIPFTYVCL